MATSRSFGATRLTGRPSMAIVPEETSSRPATIRNAVDLPQPDGPTNQEFPVADLKIQIFDDGDVAVAFAHMLERDDSHRVTV